MQDETKKIKRDKAEIQLRPDVEAEIFAYDVNSICRLGNYL